ncbi:unnamed protein product, partial [Musa textilis]
SRTRSRPPPLPRRRRRPLRLLAVALKDAVLALIARLCHLSSLVCVARDFGTCSERFTTERWGREIHRLDFLCFRCQVVCA